MKSLVFHCLLALAAAYSAWANPNAGPGLASAQQALDDGLPTLAIYRIEQVQPHLTTDDEKKAALRLRVRALNDAGRYADTIALLEASPKNNDELLMALGQAYAGSGATEKALPIYEKLFPANEKDADFKIEYAVLLQSMNRLPEAASILERDQTANPEIALTLASIRLRESKPQEALDVLSKIKSPAPDQALMQDFLSAKALLAMGRVKESGEFLSKLQNPPPALAGQVLLVRTEYLRKTDDLAGAEKAVEKFIDEAPLAAGLDSAFGELDSIYGQQGAASGTELRRWSQDETQPSRKALALYYLARSEARNGKIDRSQQIFQDFLQKFPDHPLVDEARFGLASSYLASGEANSAIDALKNAPADGKAGFLRGSALAALGKYTEAAASFLLAAQTSELKSSALFNAAVCNTLAGVPEAENKAFQEIAASEDGAAQTRKLRLSQALFLADKGDPKAEPLLKKLADGDDKIARRAQLALAEWAYSQHDFDSARRELDGLRKISTADPAERERAEYLAIFLADNGAEDSGAKASGLAEVFLKNHPNSTFEPEVRMKLGEILFRKGDYLGARGQFDAILEDSGSSPLADKAAFLSAQAMSRSMDPQAMEEALVTYDNVVKGGGELAMRARLAQAMLFNSLKRSQDALGVLDRLLDSQPDAELRAMALIEKGNTYFTLGANAPENYKQAIATWQILASDPAASISWHNQALTKMGGAYEKLGDTGAALNCYYNVFSAGQKGEPEYFWFYKAGFDAGHLLESQNLWNEAIAVYEKIGALEGPRAEEARNRVSKLRLENFLWEN